LLVVFEDDRLRRLYEEADYRPARYGSDLIKGFRKKVGLLRAATSEVELRSFRSLNLEKLKGEPGRTILDPGEQPVEADPPFRDGDDGRAVVIVELVDYH